MDKIKRINFHHSPFHHSPSYVDHTTQFIPHSRYCLVPYFSLSHYRTVTLSHIALSIVAMSHCRIVALSHYGIVTLSHFHTVTLSHCLTFIPSQCHTVALSHHCTAFCHTSTTCAPYCMCNKKPHNRKTV
jgi:hypothetical protein